jgi:uncharacterized protein YukE
MRPPWNPNWEDVRFDHAAVLRAADDCDLLAASLDQAAETRAAESARAAESWSGRRREQFDDDLQRLLHGHADLVAGLRRLARQLRDRSDDARREQAHRKAVREEWHRRRRALEQREERRRAAEVGT